MAVDPPNPNKPSNLKEQNHYTSPKAVNKSATDPFLFIFSMSNSGTTVFSQFLSNNIKSSYLPPHGNNEGQWIPEVLSIMRNHPWEQVAEFDWSKIKKIWTNYLCISGKNIFIEASPPNMMRVDEILTNFSPIHCIFFTTNPYMQIASSIHRYFKEPSFDQAVAKYSEQWLNRAQIQIKNCKKFPNFPLIKYEKFCKNPKKIIYTAVKKYAPHISLASDKTNNTVQGKKNFPIQSIVNMTPKHLAFLGVDGIELINSFLAKNRHILDYYGYNLLSIDSANAILNKNILLANQGLINRLQWQHKFQIHS